MTFCFCVMMQLRCCWAAGHPSLHFEVSAPFLGEIWGVEVGMIMIKTEEGEKEADVELGQILCPQSQKPIRVLTVH